jgi:hypothetical protein
MPGIPLLKADDSIPTFIESSALNAGFGYNLTIKITGQERVEYEKQKAKMGWTQFG